MSPATPRIPPLEPPYDPDTAAMLARWMPPGAEVEPLRLFRTLAVHPELLSRMRPLGAGILGHGLIEPREREIVLLRTCARAGAWYEWGVHTVAFGRPLGLSDAHIEATAAGTADDPVWTARERTLVRLADELCADAAVSEATWSALAPAWSPAEILELVTIAGWYRLIASIIRVAGVEDEPWAERRPLPA